MAIVLNFVVFKYYKVSERSNDSLAAAKAAPGATTGTNTVATTYYDIWGSLSGDYNEDGGPPSLVDESSDGELHEAGEAASE